MSDALGWADAVAHLTAPSQLFAMEEQDVLGIRMRTWRSAPPTLRAVLDGSLRHGDDDYVVSEGERMTYDEHYRRAATLAHRLRTELGVRAGDRVAIAMRNLPEWIVSFWGAIAAGAVVVPLNAWWTADELAYAIADSGSVAVLADDERARRIKPSRARLPDLRALVAARDADATPVDARAGADALLGELVGTVAPDAVPPEIEVRPDDDATIFYTSGTTGRPKGAVGTHRNACTNLMSLFFFQAATRLRLGPTPDDAHATTRRSYLLSVPLFHATGCMAVLLPHTAAGAKLVLMRQFDPEGALELIEREQVTSFGGVPTVVLRVLDCPDLARRDVSSVRSVSYGGAPAPASLVARIAAAFPGAQPGNGYGLTETSAATALNVGADYAAKPDSVGRVVPVADLAVVPEGHEGDEPPVVPAGTVGELWVRGPHVVRGYWNRPDDSDRSITRGWLHTGDIGYVDDEGFVYVVDRAKDVVIRGGENVYSVEVERALASHPAVTDCAVIGVPHPVLGEEVGAVVVLRPGTKVAPDELAAHVAGRLAAYNVPSRFWFQRAPLPRNVTGKVEKRTLRDQLTPEHAARGRPAAPRP